MTDRLVQLLSALVVSASIAAAQPPPGMPGAAPGAQPPPRDRGPSAQTGTAAIRGRVFAGDTGKPLRRARVTISAPELGSETRTTSTSADGRFEVKDLPAGRYSIRVVRSGYLPLQYGQRRPLEQGTPLQVADRQAVDNIDFSLPRSATISGRIIDELSEPVADVQVFPMRLMYWQGSRRLVPAGTGPPVRTDEAGEYRLSGLVPGSYVVMAMLRETWTVTEDGVERSMGYAPTYYPGTTAAAEARRVAVEAGKDASNTSFALMPGRAATISGTAFDSSGAPLANRGVQLTLDMSSPNGIAIIFAGSASTGADGAFTLKNIPPGSYKLRAQAIASTSSPQAPIMEVIAMPITLDGSDVENVALITASGGWVRGHVLTDAGVAPDVPRERFDVRTIAADGNTDPPPPPPPPGMPSPPGTVLGENGRIQPDWSFSLGGVRGPSRFRVRVPDGWWVKTIVQDGREIIDTPIEVRGGEEMNEVQVIVSNRVTSVNGRLSDTTGNDAPGTVIVFADDSSKWWSDSRWVLTARPDQQGRYEIKGLPPGEYLAVAVSYVEDGSWNDPEYLESLRRYAQRFTLAEGQSLSPALKVITP